MDKLLDLRVVELRDRHIGKPLKVALVGGDATGGDEAVFVVLSHKVPNRLDGGAQGLAGHLVEAIEQYEQFALLQSLLGVSSGVRKATNLEFRCDFGFDIDIGTVESLQI